MMAPVSILSHQHASQNEHTGIVTFIMRCNPFSWINNIQSLEKILRRKPFRDCASNLIRKFGNPFPRPKVTAFPLYCVSSPSQFELGLA